MFEVNRDCLKGKYHRLSIKNCPYNFIVKVANLGENIVTVENYNADATVDNPKIMNLGLKDRTIFEVSIRSLSCSFETNKKFFLKMLKDLEEPSFYSVFHKKSLKFTASEIADFSRYRALDNFGWNLEISTQNNSIEYTFFTSPDKNLIDKIELLFR